jgi:hypothetical protein
MAIPHSRPNNPFLKKNLTKSNGALKSEDTESELGSEGQGMNDILSKYKKKLNK